MSRTTRTSIPGQPQSQDTSGRSNLLAQMLMQQAVQPNPYRQGDPTAVAFQPALAALGALFANKRADRSEAEKSQRIAQMLTDATSPMTETTPGTPEQVMLEGVLGPPKPGTPDVTTQRPRTLDETISILGQTREGQPLAQQAILFKLQQQMTPKKDPRMERAPSDVELRLAASGAKDVHPILSSSDAKILRNAVDLAPVQGFSADGGTELRTRSGRGAGFVPKPKEIPANVVSGINENLTNLTKINDALDAIDPKTSPERKSELKEKGIWHDPEATGAHAALLPDFALNRLDPKGTPVRSIISDIGSFKIHLRSGAAVSATEFPRLRPFIPSEGDSPQTVRDKLKGFKNELASVVKEEGSFYSKERGYSPHPGLDSYMNPSTKSNIEELLKKY